MKSVINVLGKKNFWIVQTFYFISFSLIALLKFYETVYLKYVIDAYFGYNQPYKNLNLLLTYILIIIAGLFINYFRILLIKVLNKKIYEDLSNKIVKRFLSLKWYDVYTSNAADTHKLINNDINILMPILFGFYPNLAVSFIFIIIYTIYLSVQNYFFILLSACVFLTLFITSKKFDEVLKAQSRFQRESYIEKESFILNMFKGFKYIYANSLQNKTVSDFDIVNKRVNTHSINIAYTSETASFVYASLTTVSVLAGLLILFFTKKASSSVVSAGLAAQVSLLITQILGYFSSCLFARNKLNSVRASLERIESLFLKEEAAPIPSRLPLKAYIIKADGKKTEFKFEHKKINLMCAGNGSGKTTLLNAICGLEHKYEPKIEFEYEKADTTKNCKSRIAYLTNEPYLQNGTAAENIFKAREENVNFSENIQAMFKIAGLNKDTQIENFGENLSAGQKQIIHILRLLGTDAEIILMDEPDSALSPEAKTLLYKELETLVNKKNKTIILISHNEDIAQNVDKDIINVSY